MLDSFNKCNILKFINKNTPSEDFNEIPKVVLDCISDNMASFVHTVKYVDMNA